MEQQKYYLKRSLSLLLSVIMIFSVFSGLNITVGAGDVLPESAHPYEDDCDETRVITREGAKSLAVTFSEDTYTEEDYDFITLYSADDVEIGSFSGSALADFTVEIPGDTLKIQLTSDSSYNEYGFKVTAVETLDYEVTTPVIPDTSGGDDWEDDTDNVTEDGFRYEIIDNQVTIIGYSGTETAVVIPSEIDGYLVTSIGYNAFSDCTSLTSIEIPDSVTSIDSGAFSDCTSLTSIEIPDSVTSIDSGAFSGCTGLTSIVVDIDNSNYSSADGVLFNKDKTLLIAYPVGKTEASYIIPDSVITIGEWSFDGCVDLTSIEIPNSVTSIESGAFCLCLSLESVTIPDSVMTIGHQAFCYCERLTSINIGSKVYSIDSDVFYDTGYYNDESNWQDGVLYLDTWLLYTNEDFVSTEYTILDGTELIASGVFSGYTFLETVIIPESVKYIDYHAFDDCENLTSITVGNSISYIGSNAFNNTGYYNDESNWQDGVLYLNNCLLKADRYSIPNECVILDETKTISDDAFEFCDLESVVIPKSVENVGDCAFCNSKLSDIFYGGSEAEWNNIAIGSQNTGIIDANIHYNTNGNHYKKIAGEEPTCTEDGIATYQCDCGYTKTVEKEAVGHKCVNNICTVCGSHSFLYEIENGEVTITMDVCSFGELVIPEEIEGYPVTGISDYAFSETYMTSVTIPKTVKNIGELAFWCSGASFSVDEANQNYCSVDGVLYTKDKTKLLQYTILNERTEYIVPDGVTSIEPGAFTFCQYLTSVTIPESVTSIGYYAFAYCEFLSTITVEGTILDMGNDAFVETSFVYTESNYQSENGFYTLYLGNWLLGVFKSDENEQEFVVREGTKGIANSAFGYCDITSVVLPDGLLCINSRAFQGTDITSITIPASVNKIGENEKFASNLDVLYGGVFVECYSLTSITVENDNPNYCSVDGVLFNKDKTKIIAYPAGNPATTYVIPDGIVNIDDGIFSHCKNLTSVVIPDSVKNIGNMAFYNCTKLTSVTISDGVENIGVGAFFYCDGLNSISIPGSVKNIGGLAFGYCSSLTSATISEGVENIFEGAFVGCSSLTSVEIPSSVKSIGNRVEGIFSSFLTGQIGVFQECSTLNEIIADETNQNYCSVDGVLFNKDKTCLVCYPVGKEQAFYAIPDGVKKVEAGAFYYCKTLKTLVMPVSVVDVGFYAFYRMELQDIFYSGTQKQWNKIKFDACDIDFNEIVHFNHMHTIDVDESIAPTCIETGLTEGEHCSVCGIVIREQTVVPATGHAEVIDEAVAATCTQTGLTEGKHCSVCNEVIVSQEVVSATGHTEVIDEAVAATCTETGLTEGNHCSVCGEVIVAQEEIPATGHNYKDGVCTVCDDWNGTEKEVKLKFATNVTGGVKISWSAIPGAEKYVIYRKTSAKADWKKLYTTKTAASSYTDKTAKSGTKYYYTVKAARDGEYSKYDNDGVSRTYLAVPKISSVANKSSYVEIKWGKVTGASSYDVYRKVKGGSWAKLDSTKSTTFKDKTAKAGKVYEYKVRAKVGKSTTSEFSSVKKIVRLTTPKLTKVTPSKGKVTFTFGKVTGAEKYYIYRKTGSGSYKKIATTTSTKYVDKSVKKGTTYTYTVKAVKSSYSSAYNSTGLKVKAK